MLILVDSGAEISLIPFKMGQDLGYQLAESELTLLDDKSVVLNVNKRYKIPSDIDVF